MLQGFNIVDAGVLWMSGWNDAEIPWWDKSSTPWYEK